MTVIGRTFENDRIEVDGQVFERCTFNRCRIVYSAVDGVTFKECRFYTCDWVFNDGADLTLRYLSALYRGIGAEGRELVESIFNRVRSGDVSQEVEESAVLAR